MKILVVNDSLVMRSLISRAIIKIFDKDIEMFKAGNGRRALEILEEHKDIKLVFTDWHMPYMTGLELVTNIRKNELFNDVTIIMITAECAKNEIAKLSKLGIQGYIKKPFEEATLIKSISEVKNTYYQ